MNFQKMMKQAQEMQKKMQEAQERLKTTEFEGVSGGGLVKVTLTGDGRAKKIFIDENLFKEEGEKEMLEDLIVAAFNDAKSKVDDETTGIMGRVTGGMKLPSGFGF